MALEASCFVIDGILIGSSRMRILNVEGGLIFGSYLDNGKENGNYRDYRGYIGVILVVVIVI